MPLPGIPLPPPSVYDPSFNPDVNTAQQTAIKQSPCPTCNDLEIFKAMVGMLSYKKMIKSSSFMTDAIPGMASPIRDRFTGNTANSSINIQINSNTQFTLSHSNCSITFKSNEPFSWSEATIIPICLSATDYKNATLTAIVNDTAKVIFTIESTCKLFYCDGQEPKDTASAPTCNCTTDYNNSTSYTTGSVVKYNGKCYILNKGTSLNNLVAGKSPTESAFWNVLCESPSTCKDALKEDFESLPIFTTQLTQQASTNNLVGPQEYMISNTININSNPVNYTSKVLFTNPSQGNKLIYGKQIVVEANRQYQVSFNAFLAWDDILKLQGLQLKLNGNTMATYPSFGSALTNCSVTYNSGASTTLLLELYSYTNTSSRDILAIDNIQVICLESQASSPPIKANNDTSKSITNRYIPKTDCACPACDIPLPLPSLPFIPCDSILKDIANQQAHTNYQNYRDSLAKTLLAAYYAKCMQTLEQFAMKYTSKEYHYTLYFYDQSGNLVKTIPPQGFTPHTASLTDAMINTAREGGASTTLQPPHYMASTYKHNALNAVLEQLTPDAGKSEFKYDRLGRIVLSRNAVQLSNNTAAYTYYDKLGRLVEVGKINNLPAGINLYNEAMNYLTWPTWIQALSRSEIIRTYYDNSADMSIANAFGINSSNFLRNRIGTVATYANNTKTTLQYEQATHYRYDISGNVLDLLQDYGNNSPFGNNGIRAQSKRLQYDFDLVSGKVNALYYELGRPDQFMYRYKYNADNKILEANSSHDGIIWERDAKYIYYQHEPLARTEIGSDKVQGLDYIYNLQGWIKGVNGFTKDFNSDAGYDGSNVPTPSASSDPYQFIGYTWGNNKFGADAAGYWLSYFKDDYSPIALSEARVNQVVQPLTTGTYYNAPSELFNGNIRAMYTQLSPVGGQGMLYKYDQLNRIKQQDAYDFATGIGVPTINNAYQMKLTYDANGNILTLLRNANAANFEMDELKYSYYNYNPVTGISNDAGVGGTFNCNRLAHVHDDSPIGNIFTDDIETQGNDNYTYDAIGNLIKDNAEGISQIDWNLQNKISKIQKANLTLAYEYDPTGKRIIKTNIRPGQPDTASVYVLDPQGNTLAIYRLENSTLTWQEQHLYGSSRIGITREEKPIARLMKTGGIGSGGTGSLQQGSNFDLLNGIQALGTIQALSTYRAQTEYELTNHLGNVLATVSDAKQSTNQANMLSYTDYYAFGMPIKDRTNAGYRYDYNGKETDDETGLQDYGFRIYNKGLGRFLSVDPLTKDYPYYTPYQFAGNKPIQYIDLDGGEEKKPNNNDETGKYVKRKNEKIKANENTYDQNPSDFNFPKGKETSTLDYVKDYSEKISYLTGQKGNVDNIIAVAALPFTRAAKMAKDRADNIKQLITLPNTLSESSSYVVSFGEVSSKTAKNIGKVTNIVGKVATGTGIIGTTADIIVDGKITKGDIAVAVNTALQIYCPVYGLAIGIYDLSTLVTGMKTSSEIVRDIVDENIDEPDIIDFNEVPEF